VGGEQPQNVLREEVYGLREFFEFCGVDGALVVNDAVDGRSGIEEVADDERGSEVVVHGIVALLAQF